MASWWHPSRWASFGDSIAEAWDHAVFSILELWRAGPVHQAALLGDTPTGIAVAVRDPRLGDERRGSAMLGGVLVIGKERLEVPAGWLPFDAATSAEAFDYLHAFSWLPDLLAAGAPGRKLALDWSLGWVERWGQFNSASWTPGLCGARLCILLGPGGEMLADAASPERARLLTSIAQQLRHLARSEASRGDPIGQWSRALALALGAVILENPDSTHASLSPLAALSDDLILSDGGHVSRSADQLLDVMTDLSTLDAALAARNQHLPEALAAALDRGIAALRFFRMPDGKLCTLAGSGEGDCGALAATLDDAEPRSPFANAPSSGFQRIDVGNTVLLIDVGGPPRRGFHHDAFAAPLALEIADGPARLVVSVGPGAGADPAWREASRATAASSTVTLADTSADIPRALRRGGSGVRGRRADSPEGPWLEARHDWYLERFGLAHRRRVTISPDGLTIKGEDALFRPVEQNGGVGVDLVPWAMRFHLHPDVRAGLARDGKSVVLELDNGKAWRFRADGGPVALEPSLYTGGAAPRPSVQIVVTGLADPADSGSSRGNAVAWTLAREGKPQ